MSRIRSVHPTQWTDEQFVTCSPLARLMSLGVRNESDDNGIFEWNPAKLKIRLLPLDDCDAGELLSELLHSKQVFRFSSEGKEYGMIKNFQKFQKPRKPTFYYPIPQNQLPTGYTLNPRYGETSVPPVRHQYGKSDSEGIGIGGGREIEIVNNGKESGGGAGSMGNHVREPVSACAVEFPMNLGYKPRSQAEWAQILCQIRNYSFEQLAKVKVYAMFKRWIQGQVSVGELVDANAVVIARKDHAYVPPLYLDWAVKEIIEARAGVEHGTRTASRRDRQTIVDEVAQINGLTAEEKAKLDNWVNEKSL